MKIFVLPFWSFYIHYFSQSFRFIIIQLFGFFIGGGGGSLRDLDGVRCWVPCVDSPDQRAIYDITIHAPSSMQILSCGIKVSTAISSSKEYNLKIKNMNNKTRSNGNTHPAPGHPGSSTDYMTPLDHCFTGPQDPQNKNDDDIKNDDMSRIKYNVISSRFFTSTRIPCMSLGFFIGQVICVYLYTRKYLCLQENTNIFMFSYIYTFTCMHTNFNLCTHIFIGWKI